MIGGDIIMKEKLNGVNIICKDAYKKEKKIIKDNYKNILKLIKKLWSFDEPEKVNIYIMKSDFKFALITHPILNKVFLLTLLLPYWVLKERKKRKKWRGVSHFKKDYPCILLKPMEAYRNLDSELGNIIYKTKKNNLSKKFKITLCDQLLSILIPQYLTLWLNEGITSVTIEKYIDKQIYKVDSLKLLKENYCQINVSEFSEVDNKTIAYNYTKGYWTVRYLEEEYPGFLKKTIKKYKGEEIVKEIGKKLGLDTNNKDELWEQIDDLLYDHYQYLLEE